MHFWDKKKILGAAIAAVLAVGIFYSGLQVGLNRQDQSASYEASSTELNANFSLFWNAVQTVKDKYYGIKNVSDQDIVYGAIKGVMSSLGDPYSVFFSPSDSQKFSEDLNGNFGGVGMEVGIRDNQLVVIAPLKGNPAYAIGLKAGDQILQVDATSTDGLDVDSAVKLIRGPVGTDVKLLIMRDGWKTPKEFNITRVSVQVPTLDWQMKDGNIAYIQLYNFNANASSLFYNAALSALVQGARGVVLDLRNDPGGYLDTAVGIAGFFLNRGDVVVREEMRSGKENTSLATGPSAFADIPTVVLVNGGSASAAEILAGALQDIRGIKLIGEKTFGKGSVQEITDFPDGSSAKISVAEWLTPNKRHINKVGIEPDIKVPETASSTEDVQLNKALEVVKAEMVAK